MQILTETEERHRGEILAKGLKLRKDAEHKDRYQTAWGTKTALGLFRIVQRMVLDGE